MTWCHIMVLSKGLGKYFLDVIHLLGKPLSHIYCHVMTTASANSNLLSYQPECAGGGVLMDMKGSNTDLDLKCDEKVNVGLFHSRFFR